MNWTRSAGSLGLAALAVLGTGCASQSARIGEKRLVRESEGREPQWIGHIDDFQKRHDDRVYAVGGIQFARNREHALRDGEMLGKARLAQRIAQKIRTEYAYGRSGERDPEVEGVGEYVEEAIAAEAENVLRGAHVVENYWREWEVVQPGNAVRYVYEVNVLVAVSTDDLVAQAHEIVDRAQRRLDAAHRGNAAQVAGRARDLLVEDGGARLRDWGE